jgi:hypothetical protein
MAIHLTNQLLNQLLSDLGFQPGEVSKKNQRTWRHPESGCVLFLPANKLQEAPWSATIVGIRAQLALQGHLDKDSFDYFAVEGRLPAASAEPG